MVYYVEALRLAEKFAVRTVRRAQTRAMFAGVGAAHWLADHMEDGWTKIGMIFVEKMLMGEIEKRGRR